MESIFWSLNVLLAAQLLFVMWNLSQLPRLGEAQRANSNPRHKDRPEAGQGCEHSGERQKNHEFANESKQNRAFENADLNGHSGEPTHGDLQITDSPPILSILVPARDEADNIAECIKSILAERFAGFEVLVLDDQSSDGTAELARAAAGGDQRLTVLTGLDKPSGWTGKSFACQQLAQAAKGDWLLFMDADARLVPGALEAAMATATAQRRGLVTGFPRQQTGSWMERLIVPLMTFTIACHLPIRYVRQSVNPAIVAAHGAFMLVRTESYFLIGGHAAFKSHLVDDMELARTMKRAGLPVTLANVQQFVTMRMYRDASAVWNGYKKNIFAGVGRHGGLLLFVMLLYILFYIVPPIAVLLAGIGYLPLTADWLDSIPLAPSITAWLLGIVIKAAVDRSNGQPLQYAMLLPAGIAMLSALAYASWRAAANGGYVWKGRRYR